MTTSASLANIISCLRLIADETKAKSMSAYMRNQFPFLGIPTPERRIAIRSLNLPKPSHDMLIEWVEHLWQQPEREYVYTAIDLMKQHHQQLSLIDLPWLQSLVEQYSWWDSVDNLASLISKLLKCAREQQPHAQNIMDEWLIANNLWVRRTAMIHQLGWRLETDTDRLARYALALATEKDFFIRKAIGWALRDYARWHPQWVIEFVNQHQTQLALLSVREAMKHLS